MAKQFTVQWVVLDDILTIKWEGKWYGFDAPSGSDPSRITSAESFGGFGNFSAYEDTHLIKKLDNLVHRSYTYNKQEGTPMDTHTTQYKISVMQAAESGKTIMRKHKYLQLSEWSTVNVSSTYEWNWLGYDYHVAKPWYEDIPRSGILCYVKDEHDRDPRIESVIQYNKDTAYPFETLGSYYVYATPLTESEVVAFIRAAQDASKGVW